MTTYKGIAAATQTIAYIVGTAARSALPEAKVTVQRPEQPAAGTGHESRVNVYLVQVAPEPTMRSQDLPTRGQGGRLVAVPQVPLNLRYLFSYFGPTERAHLMLGAIEVALREHPVLDPQVIDAATEHHPELAGSGLQQQVPPVRIVPVTTTLEDLTRFWSGFLQMPYTLSTLHEASAVILSSDLTPAATLPVSKLGGATAPGGPPPRLDDLPPVAYEPGAPVPVGGRGVAAGQSIGVGAEWVPIVAAADGQLTFALPRAVRAGPQPIRLGTAGAPGAAPVPVPGSPPETLRVRPAIEAISFDPDDRLVTMVVEPPVQPGQRVVLSLVATAPGGDAPPPSVQIATTPAQASAELALPLPGNPPQPLPPGDYVALLEVDGVASLPVMQDGRFAKPAVTLR